MTDFLGILVAAPIALLLNLLITSRIRKWAPPGEATALTSMFRMAVLVRYALALFLNFYSGNMTFADMFWGDSSTYDVRGFILAEYWAGRSYIAHSPELMISGWGFFYFVGFVYFIFGRNQLLVQFLNGTIGAVNALLIYAIAVHLFDTKSARKAALFMAFFPQMVFWSGGMYKDPAIIFCIATSMYAAIRLAKRFEVRYIALFIAACLGLMTLRFYIFYIVAFATLGTFLFSQRRGLLGTLGTYAVVLGAFFAALSFAVRGETVERQRAFFDLQRVQVSRADQSALSSSAIGSDLDVSTPAGALAAVPIGLAYLLFAPFPWSMTSIRQLLTLPEMLVWYSLIPALVRGLRYTIREKFRDCLPILVFAGMLMVAYAIFQGNVGTVYRQRTQITMFLFIFMGVGVVEKQRQRERSNVRPAFPPPPPRPAPRRI
jgi:4-amino-4-deoxy-L-arabinose transferase-like glycosyltransferase